MEKKEFKPGDKFILELGKERKMFKEFEIAGTDLYVKKDLLEKLTPYKPEQSEQSEHEYTMEEFMYGQDMGNPEDGSL